jgi:hypothetical protein
MPYPFWKATAQSEVTSEVTGSLMNTGLNIQMLDNARHTVTLSECSVMKNKNLVVAFSRVLV